MHPVPRRHPQLEPRLPVAPRRRHLPRPAHVTRPALPRVEDVQRVRRPRPRRLRPRLPAQRHHPVGVLAPHSRRGEHPSLAHHQVREIPHEPLVVVIRRHHPLPVIRPRHPGRRHRRRRLPHRQPVVHRRQVARHQPHRPEPPHAPLPRRRHHPILARGRRASRLLGAHPSLPDVERHPTHPQRSAGLTKLSNNRRFNSFHKSFLF